MLKKSLFCAIFIGIMIIAASPVFAAGGQLKGQEIVIGNWWSDYDVNTYEPSNDNDREILEYRKKMLKDNGFKMKEVQVGDWGVMLQTITTSIMAGKPEAQIYVVTPSWAMSLFREGLLADVSKTKVDIKNAVPVTGKKVGYNQTVNQMFTFDKKQYAFTSGVTNHSNGIYFNKRLFTEAGINPNTPYDMQKAGTWTWQNFYDLCKKLTRDTNNDGIIDVYAMAADSEPTLMDMIVFSNGAEFVSKDKNGKFVNASNKPEFIEAVQYFRRFIDEGIWMTRPEGGAWNFHISMFTDGKIAMIGEMEYQAGAFATNMKDDWGYVLFPKGPRYTGKDYRFANDENVCVIPVTYQDQVDAIINAYNLWNMPLNDDWKTGLYQIYRDRRAVDETMATYVRGPKNTGNGVFRNHMMVPSLNVDELSWQIRWYDGQAAKLIESFSTNWNALINDANER